jgi:DNA-binding LacI/PurR family transcriptional regulator
VVPDEGAASFIERACASSPTSLELEYLGELLGMIKSTLQEQLEPTLEEAATRHMTNSVHDEFPDDEVFESVEPDDASGADEKLRALIKQRADAYGVTLADAAIDRIVVSFDIESRAQSYFQAQEDDCDDDRTSVADFHIDEIDDLFERTRN